MRALREDVDPDRFMERVDRAPHRLLLLDYDGTLAPFREERDRAVPYAGVRERVEALVGDPRTRVVVVSGRWSEDLLPLLAVEPRPEVWGSHGWERVDAAGQVEVGRMDEEALRGLQQADRWAEEAGLQERAEEKPGCLAVHTRGLSAEEAERVRSRALAAFRPLAARAGLAVHEFDGGVELRVPGRTKGDAVRAILAEAEPEAPAAYLGDDLTDEDAFRALGDRGLGVLVRPEPRPTAADVWIRPPEELLAFMDRWLRGAPREDGEARS